MDDIAKAHQNAQMYSGGKMRKTAAAAGIHSVILSETPTIMKQREWVMLGIVDAVFKAAL